eukprot:81243_1
MLQIPRTKTQIEQDRAAFQNRADAYNTFVLVGTLLTGFGITFLFEYDESLFKNRPILLTFFLAILSLVIVFSGLGSIIMALEYYNIKKLLAIHANKRLSLFEQMTHKYKNIGRVCVYLAFLFLYLALGLYIFAKASDDALVGSIISMAIFFIAFILVFYFGYRIKSIQRNLRKNPTKYGDLIDSGVQQKQKTTEVEQDVQTTKDTDEYP